MKFLVPIDMTVNEIQNALLQKLSTPPTAVEARFYYDTVTHTLKIYNGTDWTTAGDSYIHPTSSGNKHIPAGGSANQILRWASDGTASWGADTDTIYTHPNHSGDVTSVADGATTIANSAVTNAKMANVATNTIKGRVSASTGVVEDLTAANVRTIINVADGANNYSHPNHSGDVTSVADGATTIANNVVSNAKLATVASGIIKGRLTASTGNVEDLTATNVRTLINVQDGANNYSHPTGDGNLHVPANSTTNSGKILTSGASAGTYTWETNAPAWANVANKPSSAVADIDDAVSKRHSQNTDTGTTSATFTVGSSGPKLKNAAGEIQLRNNGDTDYAALRVGNLTVEGTQTIVNSNEVDIGDSEILLNADITTSAGNSDGGVAVKRLMADNTTRKDAKIVYNNSTDKWDTTQGAVAGALVTAQIANKFTATLGNGALTDIVVMHNLNTRDLVVTIRETAGDYAQVMVNVAFTTVNTLTVSFTTAPSSAQYTITIVG